MLSYQIAVIAMVTRLKDDGCLQDKKHQEGVWMLCNIRSECFMS